MQSIQDIKHAFYINLDERTDRRQCVENEMQVLGIDVQRFPAIKTQNGAIGCTASHIKLLKHAIDNNYDHILIVEDDIQFLNPDLFKFQFNKFLELHENSWDVILLSGNNIPPYESIDESCIRVFSCQTTTGYIVNGHYIQTLYNNMKEGLQKLINEPDKHYYYAIDKYWFHLQKRGYWYLITPLSVIQREGYSNIERRNTNYSNLMLDLDKPYLFNRR